MHKRILFLDLSCPKPYDAGTLLTEAMGGTEATVVRVAEALQATGRYEVIVAQHNRLGLEPGRGSAAYVSVEALEALTHAPHAVVALRTPKALPFLKASYPGAKRFLWCHDFNLQELVEDYPVLEDSGVKILGVSRSHKLRIADALLSQIRDIKNVTVDFVYNPIDDALTPDSTPVIPGRLLFTSSPHKGLDHALYLFKRLRDLDSSFTLHVANPGYLASSDADVDGVTHLGCLPHAELMRATREAFAVFHPNTVFPETFGLVYAEANAVGTPCLTHGLGSTFEVLSPSQPQLANCRDEKSVIERLLKWKREGRPTVSCKPEFRTSEVVKRWEALVS